MKKSTPQKNTKKRPAPPKRELPESQGSDHIKKECVFPIVGIGASAGGLEALEQFLGGVAPGSGMAFVIVQHLDPTYKGIMPELLQRATAMKVIQVTDNLAVRPDHVYVIPPNRDMSLLHRVLYLLEPKAPRGLRLPIDFFFRSLAEDLQDESIGIILSGMGSDGTMGLRAIKEKAGIVLVQDPASAKFDGMPRSAIDAGLADIVAPAEELPGKIIAFVHHAPLIPTAEPVIEKKAQSALDKIVILLRAHTGHDFSLYKKSTVYRRIERRMGIHQIDRIPSYVRFLQENPGELDLLFKELLIGVTSFFRDPLVWDHLREVVIPETLKRSADNRALRAWVAGCSTGEEAYSLAITFREALGQMTPAKRCTLQIYATDLDKDAIDKARQGYYPENIAADVSQERLDRFFVNEGKGYRVSKEIREMVIFAPQNLIMDPPFTKLDFLICRNLLIYLEPEIQRKIIPLFHYALNPSGILILGNAESIGNFTSLFSPLEPRLRLFSRTEVALDADLVEFPTQFFPAGAGKSPGHRMQIPAGNLELMTTRLILDEYSPAAILANAAGDIVFINGRTGRFLEPAAGKANLNLFAMAREGLRHELDLAFAKALRQKDPVVTRGVRIGVNGGTVHLDFTVRKIEEPPGLKGLVLVVFNELAVPLVEPPPEVHPQSARSRNSKSVNMQALERKVQESEENLQTVREEMQTSQEELKSSNEELQSTNEELQSTNEELTTSKEEMQSLNEELQTVNIELQSRVEDLSHVSNDMKNLLNSTDIATIFLDDRLNVRWFTAAMTKLINLIPGDMGRPVTDISSQLIYPDFISDAKEVLRTLVISQREVMSRDGRWLAVRVLPYRTLENKIDGVVITFMDITASRKLQMELTHARTYADSIVATVREPLVVLDGTMHVVSANQSFYETFRVGNDVVVGNQLYTLGDGQWDIPALREMLEEILPKNRVLESFRVEHEFPAIGKRVMLLNARRIITEGPEKELILLAIEDVTGTRRAKRQ
jgi:chemotaxis methyl-accepting protein methylase